MTGGELIAHIDPAVPDGFAYVMTGKAEPGIVWIKDEAGEITRGRVPYLDSGTMNELIKGARAQGLTPEPVRLTLPLQQPTLKMFTEAMGKAATQVRLFADILGSALGKNRPRVVRPVPPIVPPGLSRVDSAQARSARSALLRSQRRAIRHNRALPPRPRARIFVTDPKITWEDPKRDLPGDRMDAAQLAILTTAARPPGDG